MVITPCPKRLIFGFVLERPLDYGPADRFSYTNSVLRLVLFLSLSDNCGGYIISSKYLVHLHEMNSPLSFPLKWLASPVLILAVPFQIDLSTQAILFVRLLLYLAIPRPRRSNRSAPMSSRSHELTCLVRHTPQILAHGELLQVLPSPYQVYPPRSCGVITMQEQLQDSLHPYPFLKCDWQVASSRDEA